MVITPSLSFQLTWTASSTSKHVNLTEASQAQEVVVSYLPLSHIAAQMVDIWITMRIGAMTYFAQPDALKVRRGDCVDLFGCRRRRTKDSPMLSFFNRVRWWTP